MFGCTAGGTDRFYLNARGDVQPCEFVNLSFGNIATEEFDAIYKRMREHFNLPGSCWLCEKYAPLIQELVSANDIVTLPLEPELSSRIFRQWDRGDVPDLYRVTEQVLK